jgi:hypothetical protein
MRLDHQIKMAETRSQHIVLKINMPSASETLRVAKDLAAMHPRMAMPITSKYENFVSTTNR